MERLFLWKYFFLIVGFLFERVLFFSSGLHVLQYFKLFLKPIIFLTDYDKRWTSTYINEKISLRWRALSKFKTTSAFYWVHLCVTSTISLNLFFWNLFREKLEKWKILSFHCRFLPWALDVWIKCHGNEFITSWKRSIVIYINPKLH